MLLATSLSPRTIPLQAEWFAKYDRGYLVRSFEARIRAALKMPPTQFIQGTKMASDSLAPADGVQ